MMGFIGANDVARIERLLQRAGLPVSGPSLPVVRYLELMRHDKKVEAGRLRLVLLEKIGKAIVSDTASDAQIGAAIQARIAND